MTDKETHPPPESAGKEANKESQSFWHMIQSVLAAIFGIQSDKNRQQDFKQGDPAQYITLGIVAAIALVLIMVVVVKVVLSSAGS